MEYTIGAVVCLSVFIMITCIPVALVVANAFSNDRLKRKRAAMMQRGVYQQPPFQRRYTPTQLDHALDLQDQIHARDGIQMPLEDLGDDSGPIWQAYMDDDHED